MFANIASVHCEQISTDVDNNKSNLTIENRDSAKFGRCKRADCNKRIQCVTITTSNLFAFEGVAILN